MADCRLRPYTENRQQQDLGLLIHDFLLGVRRSWCMTVNGTRDAAGTLLKIGASPLAQDLCQNQVESLDALRLGTVRNENGVHLLTDQMCTFLQGHLTSPSIHKMSLFCLCWSTATWALLPRPVFFLPTEVHRHHIVAEGSHWQITEPPSTAHTPKPVQTPGSEAGPLHVDTFTMACSLATLSCSQGSGPRKGFTVNFSCGSKISAFVP